MIDSLQIKGIATYSDNEQSITPLSQFNYFFGANGSGKTTVSRLMEDCSQFPQCNVNWSGDSIKTDVYNKDFVEANFNQQDDLPGIFTLGKAEQAIVERIAEEKLLLDKISNEIKQKELVLGSDETNGKLAELKTLTDEVTDKCWEIKNKYDDVFQDAFKGVRGSKVKFKDKVLEQAGTNKAEFVSKDELVNKAKTLLGEPPEIKNNISSLEIKSGLTEVEESSILAKRIIGKSDVDIASMITKLGNSDWVRQGKGYLGINEKTCPFCQQEVLASFEQSLNDYFDETYLLDISKIKELHKTYIELTEKVSSTIEEVMQTKSEDIDSQSFRIKNIAFAALTQENINRLNEKIKEPAMPIALKPTKDMLADMNKLITQANNTIGLHNKVVQDYKSEKEILVNQIWAFLLNEELKSALALFGSKQAGLIKAIESLKTSIETKKLEKNDKRTEIQGLEKDTTSIQPTINNINDILKSFGFTGFSLGKANTERHYSIVRSNGTSAKETLSEGEKT